MIINILERGLTEVRKLPGIEHFVVEATGEVLHLAKHPGMDLWHIVSVVVSSANILEEAKKIEEEVKTEITKIVKSKPVQTVEKDLSP